MPLALRDRRARVYAYEDVGQDGYVEGRYVPHLSSASDGNWWCSLSKPSGLELAGTAAEQHQMDAVLGFDAACPVDAHGLIVVDGRQYKVTAVLPRRRFGEKEVSALTLDAADFPLVDDAAPPQVLGVFYSDGSVRVA